jgi:erythronate-4-phosphate dehydrogenase
MKLVVDKNIPLVEKAFRPLGEVSLINTGEFTRDSVKDADVFVVRSETKVGQELLEGSSVKFVGTATIGTDHIDLDYLNSRGIAFASAPGCNSNSVKEYITAALLYLSNTKNYSLSGKTIGVVGVGNVGSKVVKAAEALGMVVLQNDPPRARVESNSNFVSLEDLMTADIITLHVPLSKTGPDATYHLFDEKRISRMKNGSVLINTSRGGVVETSALKLALSEGHLSHAILDVWEKEPNIDTELLTTVFLGTPHIAGYSLEGKINAVRMVRNAICSHFRITSLWDPFDEIDEPRITDIAMSGETLPVENILYQIVKRCYDISYDDNQLRLLLTISKDEQPKFFRKLRTGYGVRREFSNVTVKIPKQRAMLGKTIMELGFKNFINL